MPNRFKNFKETDDMGFIKKTMQTKFGILCKYHINQ